MSIDLENRFIYHTSKPGQPERYAEIRSLAKDLAYLIVELSSEGYEQELAIMKIEEAVFWANASIARKG